MENIIITKKNNELVIPKTVNISELVKNNNISLSLVAQSDMIDSLNEEFTEHQSQRYLAFYLFLNYHPTNDFPVNLENVYRDLGFANKGNAMKTIKNNFTKDEDYKIVIFRTEKNLNSKDLGGRPTENILLNIDTYKTLCMLVKTEQGKEIRKYYVKLENIYNKIIKKEIDQQKLLLEEKDKLLEENKVELEKTQKQLEKKSKLTVKRWFDQSPSHVVYAVKSNKDDTNTNTLITIGKSKNIKDRESQYMTHNQESDMFYIRKCYNCDLTEKVIHHMLDKYREESNKEWFLISNELAIYTIDLVCDFLDKFINCSEKLPEFKVKEFIDNLNITHFDTVFHEPNINVPNIIYNNELKNYDKFISECCEINEEYYTLSYDLIACYRLWCKGDMNREIKKEFLDYIKTKYITKDRFSEIYGVRSIHLIGIRPKKLIYEPDNENRLKKYEEFFIEKCDVGYTFRIGYNGFIENYIKWLNVEYPNYKITKQHHVELKEYFNRKFLIDIIPGTILGIWGFQLKTDKLPNYGIIDKKKTCKTIYKINIDTKDILEIYNGLSEASEKLNFTPKIISDYIKFNKTFYDKDDKDIRILLKYNDSKDSDDKNLGDNHDDQIVIFNKRTTLKKIYRINYDTKKVLEIYDGVIGAANKLNISTTTVGRYIKIQKTLNVDNIKSVLSYTKDIVINENEEKINTKIIKRIPFKTIYKIDLKTNELLETFNGIFDAATKLNIGECTVSRYVKSGNILKHKDGNNIISCLLKHSNF